MKISEIGSQLFDELAGQQAAAAAAAAASVVQHPSQTYTCPNWLLVFI